MYNRIIVLFGLVPILFLAVLFIFCGSAFSHVESSMPDAVAEIEYKMLLDFKPGDNATRNKLAMVLYRRNKLIEAEKEAKLVLKNVPKDIDALDTLGLIRHAQKKYPEAISHFTKAISMNPKDALLYYHLGKSQEMMGNLEDAVKNYRLALEAIERDDHGHDHDQIEQIKDSLEKIKSTINK